MISFVSICVCCLSLKHTLNVYVCVESGAINWLSILESRNLFCHGFLFYFIFLTWFGFGTKFSLECWSVQVWRPIQIGPVKRWGILDVQNSFPMFTIGGRWTPFELSSPSCSCQTKANHYQGRRRFRLPCSRCDFDGDRSSSLPQPLLLLSPSSSSFLAENKMKQNVQLTGPFHWWPQHKQKINSQFNLFLLHNIQLKFLVFIHSTKNWIAHQRWRWCVEV